MSEGALFEMQMARLPIGHGDGELLSTLRVSAMNSDSTSLYYMSLLSGMYYISLLSGRYFILVSEMIITEIQVSITGII